MTDDAARGAEGEGESEKDFPSSRPPRLSPLTASKRTRLTRLLVTKAAAEALFVLALAFGFYYTNLHARFNGAIESADGQTLSGWVVNESDASASVEVQLFIDGHFAASALAGSVPAHDEKDHAAGRQHFTFELRDVEDGEHEARAYVAMGSGGKLKTLRLIGEPVRFSVKSALDSKEQARGAEAKH